MNNGTPTLGTPSKTIFLKGFEADKLHEEFEVEGLTQTLTFSAALVTGNAVDVSIAGNAAATVNFATDSDTTMAAVAAAIAAMPGVESATVVEVAAGVSNDRVIIVTPLDQVSGVTINSAVVTGGASQATITLAVVNKNIYKGMPVEINPTTGKIQPATAATASTTHIGYAIHDAVSGQMATVALKAYGIAYMASAAALNAGPVAYSSYDVALGYNKVTGSAVTETNIMGWSLDIADGANDVIRVAVK